MNIDNTPIFEDENEKKYIEKARLIAQEEINKQREHETQKSISDKVRKIKEQFDKPKKVDVHEKHVDVGKVKTDDAFCPTCNKHNLHIHDNIAKCIGKDCGKEFMLLEKNPKDRMDYMCTSCGHTVSKKNAVELSKEDKLCPLCEKGDKFLEIDWDILNKRKK